MSLEFKEGRYYKAVWNFEFKPGAKSPGLPSPNRPGNLLGALFTDDPDRKKWIVMYRFRYYVDDIMDHKSKDEKSWYGFEFEGSEEFGWKQTLESFKAIAVAADSDLEFVLMESDNVSEQMEMLNKLSGINVSSVPKEEWAEHVPNNIAKTSKDFN